MCQRSFVKTFCHETELFDRALRGEFGEHQESVVRNKIKKGAQARKKQIIGRGSSRDTKADLTPREKAVQTVGRLMRDKGIDEYGDSVETF